MHNLSRPHAGRSYTADPSPYILLHHLFMTTQPFNHTSHRNVWKCHLSFHQSLERRLPRSKREAQIFALHRTSPSLLILSPHSPSSLVPVSTTVSPHRNPLEQPVNHPASTGKAQHTVCSNINKHRHIPTHTHTHILPTEPSSAHQLVF